eukprot:XP_001700113.1 predicted protein [Chlamydomonas reinhardtii]
MVRQPAVPTDVHLSAGWLAVAYASAAGSVADSDMHLLVSMGYSTGAGGATTDGRGNQGSQPVAASACVWHAGVADRAIMGSSLGITTATPNTTASPSAVGSKMTTRPGWAYTLVMP